MRLATKNTRQLYGATIMFNHHASVRILNMQAESTYQVFDWLWSSGQLSEADIANLPTMEIDVVINLALPSSSNALPNEAECVTREGICYIQIPVEWEQPRVSSITAVLWCIEGV